MEREALTDQLSQLAAAEPALSPAEARRGVAARVRRHRRRRTGLAVAAAVVVVAGVAVGATRSANEPGQRVVVGSKATTSLAATVPGAVPHPTSPPTTPFVGPGFESSFSRMAMAGSTVWVVDADGALLASADQGTTWTLRQSSSTLGVPVGIGFWSPTGGWLAVSPPGSTDLYLTSDAGLHWRPVPAPNRVVWVTFVDGFHAWALDGDGHLYRSTDGSASWQPVATPQPAATACATSADEVTAALADTSGSIARTTDAGAHWMVVYRTGGQHSFTGIACSTTLPVVAVTFGDQGANQVRSETVVERVGTDQWTSLGPAGNGPVGVSADGTVIWAVAGGPPELMLTIYRGKVSVPADVVASFHLPSGVARPPWGGADVQGSFGPDDVGTVVVTQAGSRAVLTALTTDGGRTWSGRTSTLPAGGVG